MENACPTILVTRTRGRRWRAWLLAATSMSTDATAMRRLGLVLVLACWMTGCQGERPTLAPRPQRDDPNRLGGPLLFFNTPVQVVLDVYRGLGAQELSIAPSVEKKATRITWNSRHVLNRPEARRKLEEVLREQAGIIITPVDDKHCSVAVAGE
jgi:hypothetical protein